MHCFGHIHEGWGALVAWKPGVGELGEPNHFNAIDDNRSVTVAMLAGKTPPRFDTPGDLREKLIQAER
jgi:hypothetical protein